MGAPYRLLCKLLIWQVLLVLVPCTSGAPFVGVNLGGWLLMEDWIFPQYFKDVNPPDEHALVQKMGGNMHPNATAFMKVCSLRVSHSGGCEGVWPMSTRSMYTGAFRRASGCTRSLCWLPHGHSGASDAATISGKMDTSLSPTKLHPPPPPGSCTTILQHYLPSQRLCICVFTRNKTNQPQPGSGQRSAMLCSQGSERVATQSGGLPWRRYGSCCDRLHDRLTRTYHTGSHGDSDLMRCICVHRIVEYLNQEGDTALYCDHNRAFELRAAGGTFSQSVPTIDPPSCTSPRVQGDWLCMWCTHVAKSGGGD